MKTPFVPTTLAGLVGGVATAVLSGKPLARSAAPGAEVEVATLGTLTSLPLAQALALVALAAWGVLLVSRGAVRRAVAVLASLAMLGVVFTLVRGPWVLRDQVGRGLRDLGVSDPQVHLTASYWMALVAALVCLTASVLAVVVVSGWPEMGRRYDAPGDREEPGDLWREIDEGRDPTEHPNP